MTEVTSSGRSYPTVREATEFPATVHRFDGKGGVETLPSQGGRAQQQGLSSSGSLAAALARLHDNLELPPTRPCDRLPGAPMR